uniref:Putative secreted protein n=1 Tax=Panstrongylus lignarius TaxID=156445 RepID=A0A224Y4H1_9HEMI
MPQTAFFAFPTGITLAFTIDIFTTLAAQNWANTLATIFSTKTWITLAVSHQALSFTATTTRTTLGHIFGYAGNKDDFLGISIVIV